MTVTPIDADGIFRLRYTAQDIAHVANLRVNLVSPYTIGEDAVIEAFSGSADNVSSTALKGFIVNKWKVMYTSTDHVDGWDLIDMQTSPPTWIFSGTDTTAGTGTAGTPRLPTDQVTMVFRDHAGKKFKQTFFGPLSGGIDHSTVVSGKFMSDWVADMLLHSSGKVGDYLCGRSGTEPLAFLAYTIQNNNALEKKILWG